MELIVLALFYLFFKLCEIMAAFFQSFDDWCTERENKRLEKKLEKKNS